VADGDLPEVAARQRRGSLLVALLVAPLAILDIAWLAHSSFPILGNLMARTGVGWIVAPLLAGWVSPRGHRMLSIAIATILLTLLIVPRTGYYGVFFLVAIPLAAMTAGGIGVALARLWPLPPVPALAVTLLLALAIAGWLIGRDKVATILLWSHPAERDRDDHALLLVPEPAAQAHALTAIGRREAVAGRMGAARRHFEDALRAARLTEFSESAVVDQVAEAEVQAGLVAEAADALSRVHPEADDWAWVLANDEVRAARFAEAAELAGKLDAGRAFELRRNIARAQAAAHDSRAALSTLASLMASAAAMPERDRPSYRHEVESTLVECGFDDDAVALLRMEEPLYVEGVVANLVQSGKPELAQRLRELLLDAGAAKMDR